MIFLPRKQAGKLFVTVLLLCILSVVSVPSVNGKISVDQLRQQLKANTGIDYTEEELIKRHGRDAFLPPEQATAPQPVNPTIDDIIAQNPDRDPEVLRAGNNQVLENLRNGAFDSGRPVPVDVLEELGRERIKKQTQEDWGIFIAIFAVPIFLVLAIFFVQKRKTQKQMAVADPPKDTPINRGIINSEQNKAKRPNDPASPAGTQLLKTGTKKCPFCAEEIKADAIKCRFCGEFLEPVKTIYAEMTTEGNRKKADGNEFVMHQLYEAVLGEKNPSYYLAKFKQFDQRPSGLKASWNWPAFFFPGAWTLYRKMYGWFFGFWIFNSIIGSFLTYAPLWFNLIVYFIEMSLFATFANSLYQNNIKNKIGIALAIKDESSQIEFLRYRGGVNVWVIWVALLLPVIGILMAIIIPNFIAR